MNTKYEEIKKIELVRNDEAVNALLKAGWVLLEMVHPTNAPVAFIMGLKDNAVSPKHKSIDAEVIESGREFYNRMGWGSLWRIIERNLKHPY